MIHNIITMKNIFFFVKVFTIYLLLVINNVSSQAGSFEEGKLLFEKKKFDKSKIFFERDIVFNPRSEESYLYLAKIFNLKEEEKEEEINLKNVILLNPLNEEAIYMLTILKIKQSNYSNAKELIERFKLVCKNICSRKKELEKKFIKLVPINE